MFWEKKVLYAMKYNRQTPCVYNNLHVVYHGIPKNASTSVKNALYEYEHGYEFEGNKQWVHKGNEKGGSIYPTIDMIHTTYINWYHFTVVRNPVDRFLSFYNDLFAGTTNIRHNIPPFYIDNNVKLEPKPVDEVLDMIEWFNDEECDEHFASQSSFVHVDESFINVIKMEDLNTGWNKVCNDINVEYKSLSVYNKSVNTVELTSEQKARIYQRYNDDFTKFGYSL